MCWRLVCFMYLNVLYYKSFGIVKSLVFVWLWYLEKDSCGIVMDVLRLYCCIFNKSFVIFFFWLNYYYYWKSLYNNILYLEDGVLRIDKEDRCWKIVWESYLFVMVEFSLFIKWNCRKFFLLMWIMCIKLFNCLYMV